MTRLIQAAAMAATLLAGAASATPMFPPMDNAALGKLLLDNLLAAQKLKKS